MRRAKQTGTWSYRIESYDAYVEPTGEDPKSRGYVTGLKRAPTSDGAGSVLFRITGAQSAIDIYAQRAVFSVLTATLVDEETFKAQQAQAQERDRAARLRAWERRIKRLRTILHATGTDDLGDADRLWFELREAERSAEAAQGDWQAAGYRHIEILPDPDGPPGIYRIDFQVDPPLEADHEDPYTTSNTGTLYGKIKNDGGDPRVKLRKFVPGSAPLVIFGSPNPREVSADCPNGGTLHVFANGVMSSYTMEASGWFLKT